jgi:hypothetical protein
MDKAEWQALPGVAQQAVSRLLEEELRDSQDRLVHEESPEQILRRQGVVRFLSLKIEELKSFMLKEDENVQKRPSTGY